MNYMTLNIKTSLLRFQRNEITEWQVYNHLSELAQGGNKLRGRYFFLWSGADFKGVVWNRSIIFVNLANKIM